MLIVPFYRSHASHVLHATIASNISLVICLIQASCGRIVTQQQEPRRLLRYYWTTRSPITPGHSPIKSRPATRSSCRVYSATAPARRDPMRRGQCPARSSPAAMPRSLTRAGRRPFSPRRQIGPPRGLAARKRVGYSRALKCN